MTHAQAVEEMKKLADGRVWALTYEAAYYFDTPQIRGYIRGTRHAEAATTYAGAIDNVKRMLGLLPYDSPPEDGSAVYPTSEE